MLPATAAALAVLAALLAWPVPALLARARWPRRDPLVALVCTAIDQIRGRFAAAPAAG